MRLYVFVTCLIPRAVTATRPLPGANIKTCRYAAAWRYAPFLCGGFDAGDRVAAISAAWRYAPFLLWGISWVIESQLRSSELWVLLRYPGLRPLRGLCPGLTFGLAATRLPGAMRLFFCGGFHGWWSRCYLGRPALCAFLLWRISWVIESQLRSSELWVLLRYPGLRPLRGRCPGLTFGLAATRPPGAMRLFFVGIRCGAESQLSRLSGAIRLGFLRGR